MRTTDQRLAEIQERSRDLIRKRKKHRAILIGTCVPMVLVLVLVGGWFIRSNTPTEGIPHVGETEPPMMWEGTPEMTESCEMAESSAESVSLQTMYANYPGISMEILSVEQGEDGTVSLEVLWKNGSDKVIFFDSRYTVAKKRKTDYMLCTEKTNFTFPSTYCTLQPGEEAQRTYRITDVYDLTEAGVYLLSTECRVVLVPEWGGEFLRPSTVHVEFTIS